MRTKGLLGNHGALPVVPGNVAFVTQPILHRRTPLPRSASDTGAAAVDPDLELIDRWRDGDIGAYEELVRRHEKRIFGLLLRMLGKRGVFCDVKSAFSPSAFPEHVDYWSL